MNGQLRNFQHETDTLREQLEEEAQARDEANRQMAKANAEIQQWKAKFESEGLAKAEELEDAKFALSLSICSIKFFSKQILEILKF